MFIKSRCLNENRHKSFRLRTCTMYIHMYNEISLESRQRSPKRKTNVDVEGRSVLSFVASYELILTSIQYDSIKCTDDCKRSKRVPLQYKALYLQTRGVVPFISFLFLCIADSTQHFCILSIVNLSFGFSLRAS